MYKRKLPLHQSCRTEHHPKIAKKAAHHQHHPATAFVPHALSSAPPRFSNSRRPSALAVILVGLTKRKKPSCGGGESRRPGDRTSVAAATARGVGGEKHDSGDDGESVGDQHRGGELGTSAARLTRVDPRVNWGWTVHDPITPVSCRVEPVCTNG
jgi:hypothetical protein